MNTSKKLIDFKVVFGVFFLLLKDKNIAFIVFGSCDKNLFFY